MLGSHRVFQYTSLPLKNARLTPASRAASTFALRPGPVLVVPDRDEHLVVLDERAAAVAVDPGRVRRVVAVGLQPSDHRVLGAEEEVPAVRRGDPRVERAVVADLERAPAGSTDVAAVTAVVVVRLPR